MKKLILAAILPLALMAGCASMSGGQPPAMMKNGMLVNAKGMTVYTFDKDVAGSGKSACVDKCAVAWPAVVAGPNDKPMGDYTIIQRADGRMQWAYQGKPLYTWPEDQEPGDKYGDNYLKVWHVVK
jgi:predicted lipoprotein with Yx(FWY)xxD motif